MLFNDPFDVQRDFDFGFDIEELKEPFVNEVLTLISSKEMPDLSSKPRIEYLIKRLRREDYDDIRKIILPELPQLIAEGIQNAQNSYDQIKNQWSEFIPDFRILCLSEIHDNILMWSHYSDSHKGAVLELQSIDELDSPLLVSQPVTYQSFPSMWATKSEWAKIITGQQRLDLLSIFTKYACTKNPEWAHEKEWRIVSFKRSGETGHFSDYPFHARELKSIYLGCDIPEEDANDIISLVKFDFSHVRIFRANKIERNRKLSFDLIK
ncbi:MAG: DUF2971 domain-containing protein [Phycisphaerales bacterium]